MSQKQLIVDLAIVTVLMIVGSLLYFMFPSNLTPEETPITNQSQATTTMPDTTNNSELNIEVTKDGSGPVTKSGDAIFVHYTGKLVDGTVFDSSIPRGQPFSFTLGGGRVIQGWDLGLLGMKVGEERRLTIPPLLAYGVDGVPGVIPPNATLIFDVTLVSIK